MGEPIVHVEIVGKDGDTLRAYYAEMFGWEFDAPTGHNQYTMIQSPTGLGGGIGTGPEDYGGHVTFYVQVPDVGQVPGEGGRGGHRRGEQVGPTTTPLAPLEVAIGGGGAALARLQDVGIHPQAHRAPGVPPLEPRLLEDAVEPLRLGLQLDGGRAGDHHRAHTGMDVPATHDRGGRLHRYTPDGRLDREVLLPIQNATMVAFGGSDLETLYVTSATHGQPGRLHEGGLFRFRPGVRGWPRPLFGHASLPSAA